MPTGTVTWFNVTKGYGFIAPEPGGADVFAHAPAVEQAGLHDLSDGQRLSSELEQGRQGKTAATSLKAL